MKVVFCASEVVPFAKTGGLADVCGALPSALAAEGAEVTVVLPAYRCTRASGVPVTRLDPEVSTARLGEAVEVLLIENDAFFDRDGLYGEAGGDYPDNLERFQFFCSRTLEVLARLNIRPDILHCHDWQTALIPVYLRTRLRGDPFYEATRSVLSIHNLAFQGIFPRERYDVIGLDRRHLSADGFEFHGRINLLKAGMLFADVLTTVSPTYAEEIQTPEFGCGLDDVARRRSAVLTGILNGIDEEIWNPSLDRWIVRYTPEKPEGKIRNKILLQKHGGLPVQEDLPLFGFVGRLTHQKGLDILREAWGGMAEEAMQTIVLGVGDPTYHDFLKEAERRSPERLKAHLTFDEPLAHRIYAGADFLIMPSVFEPCGLSQMIALKYGTIPIVRRTGGLADTVRPFREGGNGIVFSEASAAAFLAAVREALELYADEPYFHLVRERAFAYDASWTSSARQYLGVYEQCRLD